MPLKRSKQEQQAPELPQNDVVEVNIASGGMEASARIIRGADDGERAGREDVMKALSAAGVTFGIDPVAIGRVLADFGGEWRCVAKGVEREDGEEARIIYEFRTSVTRAARVSEHDKVDFWELDLFEPCKEGQVLATKVPPTQGTEGTTVRGEPVPPKPGRDKNLPKGKNVAKSEDGMQLLATASGYVTLAGDAVFVSDVFDINGDVDMSTGNITFDGSVVVRGTVMAGMTVRATKNIEVFGLVEGAKLEAGGDVILHRGILAMDNGHVHAGGCVTAQYIERAVIKANKYVRAGAIVHSSVESGGYIEASGEKGVILGGKCVASDFISVKTAGAISSVPTDLELGILPERRMRLKFLQGEIARVQTEIEKLKHLVKLLGSVNVPGEPEVRTQARENAAHTLQSDIESLPALIGEYGDLFAQIETAAGGKVHVSGTAYKGVRVVLGSSIYQVTNELEYVTFKVKEGRAVYAQYSFSGVPK